MCVDFDRLTRSPLVHFANTAHLLDMFTQERIRGFSFRMFTDRCVISPSIYVGWLDMLAFNSDHSIQKRGANRELFEYMTSFLIEKWGKGRKRKD
jgi:dipeptidyl aminopeptidase B